MSRALTVTAPLVEVTSTGMPPLFTVAISPKRV
jgi:hypothetical protein